MSEEIVAAALNIGCQMVIILFNFKSYDTYTIWHCKHYTQTHFVIMRECCLKMQKVSLKAKGKKIYFYYECEFPLFPFLKVMELWNALQLVMVNNP